MLRQIEPFPLLGKPEGLSGQSTKALAPSPLELNLFCRIKKTRKKCYNTFSHQEKLFFCDFPDPLSPLKYVFLGCSCKASICCNVFQKSVKFAEALKLKNFNEKLFNRFHKNQTLKVIKSHTLLMQNILSTLKNQKAGGGGGNERWRGEGEG